MSRQRRQSETFQQLSPRRFGRAHLWVGLLCLMLAFGAGSVSAQQHLLTFAMAETPASQLFLVSTDAADGGTPAPGGLALGSLDGAVRDTEAVSIAGATVTLHSTAANSQSTVSGADGNFTFAEVPAGPYTLTVALEGFEPWTASGTVTRGEAVHVPGINLAVSRVEAAVTVTASRHEVAAAQLAFEEKQRVLGVFPNYYASYLWDAEPLTARQKFALAWRFTNDPVAIAMTGVVAGAQQWSRSLPGYGMGAQGYAKRFGSTYTDGFTSTMLGEALLPAVFHQDPRYFVKGTGSVPSRALYALATTVICRGDNGRWQPNYSNMLGNFGSASISNLYYPVGSRNSWSLTALNSLMTTAMGAAGGLVQEFLLHHMTPNLPNYSPDATR